MKLKIEDLAPYLPYGLKIKTNNQIIEMLASELHHSYYTSINNVIEGVGHKPILRPLSDLTEDVVIEIGIIGIDVDNVLNAVIHNDMSYMEYSVHTILVKNHFDVFGLIEKGLAIDINTLK
jgi:hypothetical protein